MSTVTEKMARWGRKDKSSEDPLSFSQKCCIIIVLVLAGESVQERLLV